MRVYRSFWPLAALAFGLFGFTFHVSPQAPPSRLIIYGDTGGYLAPCGCTSPMSGGITRAATAIAELERASTGNATFVLEGSLVSGSGRQDELKAECYAEAAGDEHASALAYGKEEAALGQGLELEMNSLSNGILVQSEIDSDSANAPRPFVRSGCFVIGAVAANAAKVSQPIGAGFRPQSGAIAMLLGQCGKEDISVLFIDGDQAAARRLAAAYPRLGVVVFRSTSDPLPKPITVGSTFLITAGYHGKNVVEITFQAGAETGYSTVGLGPDVKDHPGVSEVYKNYLRRVGEEHLLADLPRIATASYAGSIACAGCHAKAFRVWSLSGHSHAYADLVKRDHGLDPDCVGCHVVGLTSSRGFRNTKVTPQLANVGCEDCHGPAARHAQRPHQFLLQKVTPRACDNCHTPDNSPGFLFSAYWPKVKH